MNRHNLNRLIDKLSRMGETDCGDLSRAQAALFHNAVQLLQDLSDDLCERDVECGQ